MGKVLKALAAVAALAALAASVPVPADGRRLISLAMDDPGQWMTEQEVRLGVLALSFPPALALARL